MPRSLYMVVERFKNKDAVTVYRRFRDNGRLAPEGLLYISSWVDDKLERCYQLMETHDRALLDHWMANWSDLVDFEVHCGKHSEKSAISNNVGGVKHVSKHTAASTQREERHFALVEICQANLGLASNRSGQE